MLIESLVNHSCAYFCLQYARLLILGHFHREKNLIFQWLRMSITETVRLVYCSWHILVHSFATRKGDGRIISFRHGIGRPRVIKEKRPCRLLHLLKHNRSQWLYQLISQYITYYNKIGTKLSVRMTLLSMTHCVIIPPHQWSKGSDLETGRR